MGCQSTELKSDICSASWRWIEKEEKEEEVEMWGGGLTPVESLGIGDVFFACAELLVINCWEIICHSAALQPFRFYGDSGER